MFRAITLLLAREEGPPLWQQWAAMDVPEVDEEDQDEVERRGRIVALKRFAKRMEEGYVAAWSEVLYTELSNEEMPFGFSFGFSLEDAPKRIHLSVELPDEDVIPNVSGVMRQRECYEDACCGLLLRIAYEIYRVLPDADDLVLTGYRDSVDPGTGHDGREIYLKCATDRESFAHLNLDAVDPSAAFAHLGGTSITRRGRLLSMGFVPAADATEEA